MTDKFSPIFSDIKLDPASIFQPNLAATIDDTRTWVDPRGYRLSDRLWSARFSDRQQIDRILQDNIKVGASPLQTARALESYLHPDKQLRRDPDTYKVLPKSQQPPGVATLTPRQGPGVGAARPRNSGTGSYAARRLARTETTRAFGAATLRAAQANPFVTALKWALSAAHDDVDQCNDNATKSSRGMPRGVWLLDEVPRYPNHPQCMCTISPYVTEANIDEAVDQLSERFQERLAAEGLTTSPVPSRVDIAGYNRSKDEAYRSAMQAGGSVDDKYREVPEWHGGPSGGRYSADEQEALRSYKASGYHFLNRMLRRGYNPKLITMDENTLVHMRDSIDSAFAKADPLTETIRVTRGQYRDVMDLPNQQVGNIYVDPGYGSTTVVPEGVGFGRGITMEIYVPKGAKVLPMDEMRNGSAAGEAEVLLPRGTAYRIHAIDLQENKVLLEVLP